MKEKANYTPKNKKNKKKIDHFLAFRRKAKTDIILKRWIYSPDKDGCMLQNTRTPSVIGWLGVKEGPKFR